MKTCCDPTLEPSLRDGSADGSQNMFFMENYPCYPFLSGALNYCYNCKMVALPLLNNPNNLDLSYVHGFGIVLDEKGSS